MAKENRFRIVLVTCGSLAEARKISRAVVEKRLAACVNVGRAPVESVYRWKGKMESTKEHLLIMKTSAARLKELEREVRKLHSYETPEFLVMEVVAGATEYLDWVSESVG